MRGVPDDARFANFKALRWITVVGQLRDSLLLTDAIGPFFRHCRGKRLNWSKVPFSQLETEDGLRPECLETIPQDFRTYCQAVKRIGYTGVTLDDVAHLIPSRIYSSSLNAKIDAYRELYGILFAIAAEEGLQVFLTTDVMYYNADLRRYLGSSRQSATEWLGVALQQLFRDFPEIAGVVIRIGETDGLDVEGDFRSQLLLRRPRHARRFLQALLPLFERSGRTLIFRTWSVGAHAIGDLAWNERTFHKVFDGIESPALVISMKYGETDFFRYLPLNKLFFVSDHKKLIEFQARREYEGFGAYPSFVGWDVEKYVAELRSAKNVVGASVWCQTGGWGKLRQLTFIRNSSPWIELNADVILRIWRGESCEEAVESYVRSRLPAVPAEAMLEFLRLSDSVIKELLYVREFAEQKLYFRRLRLPPLLYVFWDRVIVDPNVRLLLSNAVTDPDQAVREGYDALQMLHEMFRLADANGIPQKGLQLQIATFEILAVSRDYFFRPYQEETADRLKQLKFAYKRRFKRSYSVILSVNNVPARRRIARLLLQLLLRDRDRYRVLDQLVTLRALAWGHVLMARLGARLGPKFAHKQAMGIEVLFR